jgi:hypothetical protein
MSIRDIDGLEQICSLSHNTLQSIFRNPNKSAEKIQKVAEEALDQLKATDYILFLSFYNSIVRLDKKYFTETKTHPFADLIQRMGAILPQLREKIDQAILQFRDKLSSLNVKDVGKPQLNLQVKELKKMTQNLVDLCLLSPEEASHFEKCFDSIQDQFKAGSMEAIANEIVSKLSSAFAQGLNSADFLCKAAGEDHTKEMINYLKKCSQQPLDEMASMIAQEQSSLLGSVIRIRAECAISRMQPPNPMFDKNFLNNFLILVENLSKFYDIYAQPTFEACWTKTLQPLSPEQQEQLCHLLSFYPELNPAEFIPELCTRGEKKYTGKLTLDLLCSQKSLQVYFDAANETILEGLRILYGEFFKKYLMNQQAWLIAYGQYIKIPYSQAADTDRNLEGGTCLQNSLDRFALLLENPSPDEIPMGSTQSGRVTHAIARCAFADAKIGLISKDRAQKLQIQSCKRLGLKLAKSSVLCETPQELVKCLSPKDNFLGILLLAYKGDIHAINVQIDHERKIFRFIDDNLGIFEVNDYKLFIVAFEDLLSLFYSEFNQFSLQSFKKIKG